MKVFLSGVAGTGMSSLAGLFKMVNYEVLGSDSHFYPPVDQILDRMDIQLFTGYDSKNIPDDVDFCIVGNIIPRGNPELEFILNNKIPYYSMADALYKFFIREKKSVVVAGTHGKTTTTSLVAFILEQAGLEPGFFVGGQPLNFENNYHTGKGAHFVIEGDEYETCFFDRSSKFLKYYPDYLFLTSLEYDHIDFFKSEDLYLYSFKNLVNQVPSNGLIIVNNDYDLNREAVEKAFCQVISYGKKDADVIIKNIQVAQEGYQFTLQHGNEIIELESNLIGEYNLWNMCAAYIFARHIGMDSDVIKRGIKNFKGVSRRLNEINRIDNSLFFEDFAHHPTAIANVIQSMRHMYPDYEIIAVFEPRCWSLRRNHFQDRLMQALSGADRLIMKEVFEKELIPEGQALDTAKLIKQIQEMGKRADVLDTVEEILTEIRGINTREKNVILVLSNGAFGNLPQILRDLS